MKDHLDPVPTAHLQYLADLGRGLPLLHLVQEWQADIAQPGHVPLREPRLFAQQAKNGANIVGRGNRNGTGSHPLMRTLVSNDGSDPLGELLAREAAQDAETIDAGSSLAAAYADLLRQFDNKLQAVADFLLISVSEFRRHYARAKRLVQHQRSIPLAHRDGSRFRLRPWRRFRFRREPVQLELPFVLNGELTLEYMVAR